MRNRRIRVKAIRQGWTLQEILDEAAIGEETKRPKWKRRFLKMKKMLNASQKTELQSHVVAVGLL